MLEDKLLIWKLKRGSADALRAIYEKYKDDLLRVAAGLLHEKSLAEDVVHDVFASFVTASADFTLTGSLRGYFMRCVANKARNINRTAGRRRTVSLDAGISAVCQQRGPDEWIIHDEQFDRLCSAMTQLPYEQREAVIMRIQGSLKFRQIAELQDTSIKTALSRYRYGIEKLRSMLNGEVTK